MSSAKQLKISFKCSSQFQALIGRLKIFPPLTSLFSFFLLADHFSVKTFF